MRSIGVAILGVACLVNSAFAVATERHPLAADDHAVYYQSVDHRYRSRDAELQDALAQVLARCEAVHRRYDIPVECEVAMRNDYPTMFVAFRTVDAAERYLPVVGENLAMPFCGVLNEASIDARLILLVREVQMASVYACESGEFSDWVSVASR